MLERIRFAWWLVRLLVTGRDADLDREAQEKRRLIREGGA